MKMNKVKPDEYYSDGMIEIARLGNIVSMKNNGSSEDIHSVLENANKNFNEVKEKIETLVIEIKNDVAKTNPLELLLFSKQMVILATLNKMSEIEYSKDEIAVLKCTEYIQSILVSSESKFSEGDNIDYEVLNHKIIANITDLYNLLYDFYFVWMGYAKIELKIERQLIDYILEAQMSYLIRGSKYQYNQLTDLEILLKFQNEKLIELFDIDYSSIIEGLKKLEHSLSSGIIDAMDDLDKEFEQFQKLENSNKTKEEVAKIMTDKNLDKSEFVGKIFGTDLYDVIKVTGWSSKFVDALTLEMNSCSSFFTGDDYAGWPIRDLPVQKKPFIRINNKVFCFDYYSLFDNCYRVIQKSIKEQSPDYTAEWASKQKEASETLVGNIFKKIFPDANIYTDNYYPKNNSLKHCNENDLIISYEDIVIIVEVKAGSFTYTSPIIDYKSHITSFKNLVEKADKQCERTFDYINKLKLATFYTSKKIPKVTFDVKDVREFYTMSITVDNFNEFEAKAEKISFINIMNGSIVLNIDELRLYSDYFNSPLLFLHYLKERKKAAMLKTLYLNDELDHLGMYIKHNMYTLNFPDSDITKIQAYGYREDLDRYFGSLHIDELSYPKPEQEIPYEMKEIIKFIESSKLEQKSKIVSFLLDFSFEARQEFCDQIKAILVRQRKVGRMISYCAQGDLKYCVFVHQDGIFSLSEKDKIDYIYSNILLTNEKDRMIIELFYDSKNQLIDFKYRLIKNSDIPKDDFERLSEQVEILRKKRAENVKANSKKKKIGRNDPCPCGSGKKYKKCCLNNEIRK